MLKENTPSLETERLILRKFTDSDVQDILLIFGDEVVNEFLPWLPIKSMADAKEYLVNKILPDYVKDFAYRYAITLKGNNRAIGYVNISAVGQSNDLGYGLRQEFWHKGIVREACIAVRDRFKAAGFPFFTGTHDVNNPRSGAVMQAIGMTYRYSFEELWQPKNFPVIFRLYQIDFTDKACTYAGYQKLHPYFIEQ